MPCRHCHLHYQPPPASEPIGDGNTPHPVPFPTLLYGHRAECQHLQMEIIPSACAMMTLKLSWHILSRKTFKLFTLQILKHPPLSHQTTRPTAYLAYDNLLAGL